MVIFLLTFSLLLAIFSSILFWQVFQQKALIKLMMKASELTGEDISGSNHDPELVITLRVLDPIALAKRESRSARILASKLPVMVNKMVYQEVMKQLKEELEARNIDAELQIEYR